MRTDKKRQVVFQAAGLAAILLFVSLLICCGRAQALMLHMEESEAPPARLEKPPVEDLEIVIPAATPESSAQQAGATGTSQPAGTPAQPAKPKKNFHGIFRAWEPIDKALPLKSASVDLMSLSFSNDQDWARTLTSHNSKFGNYFIEAGRSFGSVKDFNLKLQSSKQLKNQYAKNEFMEMRANILGLDTVYSRKSSLSATSSSLNSTLGHNWGVNYKFDNGLTLGFASNQTKTTSSSAVAPTINRQLLYNIGWNRKKYRLNYTNTATTNYNHTSGAVSKTTQSALLIGVPVNELIEVNLRLQINGTRNASPGSAATEDNKFTKALGVSYRPNSKLSLAYNHTLTDNESIASASATDYGIVSNEYKIGYVFSQRLRYTGKSTVSSNESTGKTTDHSNMLTFDHKSYKWLPGATTFSLTQKFSTPGGGTQKTKTFSATMPLSYLKGKLGINLQRTKNQQLAVSAGAASENESLTHNVSGIYRITKTLSLNSSVNRVKSTSLSGETIQGYGENRTYNDNVTYTIRNPLSGKIKSLKKLDYRIGQTSTRNASVLPSESMTTNDSTKQSGDFAFQAADWNGMYQYSWGHARQNFGMPARVRQHKVTWCFNDLFGYRVTTNFTSGRQAVGMASNGIFRAERSLDEKSNVFLNYEFSKNQDSANSANNKFMKYFEAGLQLRF